MLLHLDAAQQVVRALVVQDQLIVIVKEHDALTDVFKDARLEDVEHAVRGIVEAAPVEQKRREAVATDGVVKQAVDTLLRPVEEHGVDQHDAQNARDHIAVLWAVFPRYPAHLADHQHQHRRHQRIGEQQVHPVQRLHLIAVFRNQRVVTDIVHGDLAERIDGENHHFKRRIQEGCAKDNPSLARELPAREANGENEQTQQHEVDIDEVDARHDRHAHVVIVQDADQVPDIHDSRAQTGIAQELARRPVLAPGHDSQNDIRQRDQDGDFRIDIQKHRIHAGVPLFPTAPLCPM